MLQKIKHSFLKELLLQLRDPGGLLILFVMPLLLILTITLIQDDAFKSAGHGSIPILLVDHDKDSVSLLVQEFLANDGTLTFVKYIDDIELTESKAAELVFSGSYQMAVVIPEKLTSQLNERIEFNVLTIMHNLGLEEEAPNSNGNDTLEIRMFFDPATNINFKNNIQNGVERVLAEIENISMLNAFNSYFEVDEKLNFEQSQLIHFKEETPHPNFESFPNSVQHNVPAWTLFAIFFIIVPLSVNMVKEKQMGTLLRLSAMPTAYWIYLLGKTMCYLSIAMIQFVLMVLAGMYLFPLIGLEQLELNGQFSLMLLVAFFAALVAIGFGVLVGTIAKSSEQAAPFGATMVVILAAIGGVWIPVFVMPNFMQTLAQFSPMNWGMEAFYDVLLRNGSLFDILPRISLMFGAFLGLMLIAVYYNKQKMNQ